MAIIGRINDYINYLCHAKSKYWIHSPFLYDFTINVLLAKYPVPPKTIEKLRKDSLKDDTIIEITDLGTGYNGNQQFYKRKTIAQITRSSARRTKTGTFLHRFLHHYQPKTVLELGTNLGFSTLYQASAVPDSSFFTVEGCPNLSQKAREHLSKFGFNNVQVVNASFEQSLRLFSDNNSRWDYVFIDGHHAYKATLQYVTDLLPMMNKNSFIILDDIYWSSGMKKAWHELITLKEISVSINLFYLGILCLHRPQAKQDFVLWW
jgi:predicted O-methyltransferase YrrM